MNTRTATHRKRLLLAEDEAEVREYLEMALRCQGYAVDVAHDGEEVIQYLQQDGPVSAVLLDIGMPRKDGLETLQEIRAAGWDVPIIVISGAPTPLNVVLAMKYGATDFVVKPLNYEELIGTLQKTLDQRPDRTPTPTSITSSPNYRQRLVSASPAMRELLGIIAQVGWSEAPVLIQGETGVGKEVIARQLHALSPRSDKMFRKLNCAALPSEMVESELFGYERGAFTGAFQSKPGMFELADGGTLLLDEIGDMGYSLQAKLLQVLQDREFERLGGKETVRVNVRVIAATHNDLEESIAHGTFRADLYYRLNVINLRVPPLRDRQEDIIALAEGLLEKHAVPEQPVPLITSALRQALLNYRWPGNVRELENVMRKLLVLGNCDMIVSDLQSKMAPKLLTASSPATLARQSTPAVPILEQVNEAKQKAETDAIVAALHSTHWNRKKAAILLKIHYKALLYKMKQLNIDSKTSTLRHNTPAEPNGSRSRRVAVGGFPADL